MSASADKRAGADALRRTWIGLTMKPLIRYGSGVSASRPAQFVEYHHDRAPRRNLKFQGGLLYDTTF